MLGDDAMHTNHIGRRPLSIVLAMVVAIGSLVAPVLFASAAQALGTYTVGSQLSISSTTTGNITVSPDGSQVYTAVSPSSPTNNVILYRSSTSPLTFTPLTVGTRPFQVAFTPGNDAYVTNTTSGTVSYIPAWTTTPSVQATIPVDTSPKGIAVATLSGQSMVYVANSGSDSVSVIDASTNTVRQIIDMSSLAPTPSYVAATPDGTKVLVGSATQGKVAVIDVATNTASAANINTYGMAINAIAISPDGNTLAITTTSGGMLLVYSLPSFTMLGTSDGSTNTTLHQIGFTGDNTTLVSYAEDGGGARLLLFNVANFAGNPPNKPYATVTAAGSSNGLAVDQSVGLGTVYVSADQLWTFNSATNPTSGAPTNPYISAGDGQLFASWTPPNWGDNSQITEYEAQATTSGGTPVGTPCTVAMPVASLKDLSCTISSGISNGTSYKMIVRAKYNGTTYGDYSDPADPKTPLAVLPAPSSASASGSDGKATVNWSSVSGATYYQVQAYDASNNPISGATCFVNATTCDISLPNGASYTFKVAALNTNYTAGPSATTNSVTLVGKPPAPINVVATAGLGSASVVWDPPASDGGSAITGYTAQLYDADGNAVSGKSCSVTSSPWTCEQTGLTPGATYTYKVTATNSSGTGTAAQSNSVVPYGPPTAPQNPTAVPGDEQATISWDLPDSDGGSSITGYTVQAFRNGVAVAGAICQPTSVSNRTCTITGLNNLEDYTFTVVATNTNGNSPESSATSAVTPDRAPAAPGNPGATAGNAQATVSWSVPTDWIGSAIQTYTVVAYSGETIVPGANCTVTASTSPLQCDVPSLTNGQTYTFEIVATNTVGDSTPATTAELTLPATPAPGNPSTSGPGGTNQSTTVGIPSGGSVTLLSGGTPVVSNTITTVEGTWTLDPATGTIIYQPAPGFTGPTAGVSFLVTNSTGATGTGLYTQTVTLPDSPVADALSSTGKTGETQSVTATVPTGGSVSLWDGEQAQTSIAVAGQGVYSVDPATGIITFTPVAGFVGTPAPVAYQIKDSYNQIGRSTYQPQVTGASNGGAAAETQQGTKGEPLTFNPLATSTPPAGQTFDTSSLRLIAGKSEKTKLVTGDGVWTVKNSGEVTFKPNKNFVGVSTVTYQVRTNSGIKLRSTLSAVVKGTAKGSAKATVYFGVLSPKLAKAQKKVLQRLIHKVPRKATATGASIGWVQPDSVTANDYSLSRNRALAVAHYLQSHSLIKKISVKANGRAKQNSWKARRATITVTWKVTQN